MTSRQEVAAYLADRLLHRVLPVFDKAVRLLPPEQLDFRPTPANMSARELACHVYQVVFLLTRTIETGRMEVSDLEQIPFEPDAVQAPEEIIAYGRQVKRYMREVFEQMTEADLERTIEKGPRPTGFETLMLAVEEAMHHRGQLMIYLRLMGAKPPHLYDYS